MTDFKARGMFVAAAALALTACGGKDAEGPKGQVVAQVGDDEITLRELNTELQGISLPNADALKQAEGLALDAIVNRKILANAAREQGIPDTPEFQLQRQRAEEVILAETLQRRALAKVARPNREEAQKYIEAHPDIFAQRKFYIVDQIQFARPNDIRVLNSFSPLKTMDEVEQKLLRDGTEYRRVPESIDARTSPPAMVEQIRKLPPNHIFLIPSGNMLMVNQIKEARVIPFTGEAAVTYAQQLIFNERANKAVLAEVEKIRKAAGKVTYKTGYGPPAKPKQNPAPNANAPAPGPAAPNGSENITTS